MGVYTRPLHLYDLLQALPSLPAGAMQFTMQCRHQTPQTYLTVPQAAPVPSEMPPPALIHRTTNAKRTPCTRTCAVSAQQQQQQQIPAFAAPASAVLPKQQHSDGSMQQVLHIDGTPPVHLFGMQHTGMEAAEKVSTKLASAHCNVSSV